jgi:hypothetical protein
MDDTLSVKDVDVVAFAYGLPQKNLVKMILFNSIATVLRKFNVVRSQTDGKVKYMHHAIKTPDLATDTASEFSIHLH